jgi:aminocarboxymuconate-semialdehyde decarboxylase
MTKAAPNLENMGKRLKQVTKLFDLDARFREMDQFGDYRQIISLPNPPIEDIADAALGQTLARIANDAMASQPEASRALRLSPPHLTTGVEARS